MGCMAPGALDRPARVQGAVRTLQRLAVLTNRQTVFPWVSGHLHREHGRVSGWVQGPHSLWRLGRLGWV